MQRQIQQLRQLLLDAQYAVDPPAVADAILARATARRLVRGVAFRNDLDAGAGVAPDGVDGAQVRSFRPTRQARSFRPCNAPR